MIRLILFLMLALTVAMQSTDAANAANRKRASSQTGQEIKTDFFTLNLPSGWKMLKPVKTHPNGDLSAVFVPDNSSLAVTINIIHVNENAQLIASTTAQNIEKTGFTATKPKNINGIWTFDIGGKENGRAWFGSNGKICAIVLMFGKNYDQANVLLANLKARDSPIFPARVD